MVAVPSEKLRSNGLPREPRVEIVVRCRILRRARPRVGLCVSPLRIDRRCKLTGSSGECDVQARTLEHFAALEQGQLGNMPVPGEYIDRGAHLTAQRSGKSELAQLVERLTRAGNESTAVFDLS